MDVVFGAEDQAGEYDMGMGALTDSRLVYR